MGKIWLALALLGSPAVVEPPVERAEPFAFTWAVPAACPARETVIADIAAMSDPDADMAGVAVRATITGSPGDLRLELHVQTSSGELHRNLSARTCDTLARATALHVALAASQRDDVAIPPPTPPPRAPVIVTSERARPQLRGAIAMAGTVGYGALRTVTAELSLSASLLHPRFRVELSVAQVLPRRLPLAAPGAIAAMAHITYATARACPRFGPQKLDVLPCAGIEAGAIRVQGHGLYENIPVRAPWLAIPIGLALAYVPHPSIAIVGRAELVVPALRPAFAVDGLGTVMRVAPAHGRFGIGLELRFPRKRST